MGEHNFCKGCKWNNYPVCDGIKMEDDTLMNIENLKPLFECIVKIQDEGIGFIKNKFEFELKIEQLEVAKDDFEARITELEEKTSDL